MEDAEGFKEFISKERRRRLRSSCSEDAESIKDLVPYSPRTEMPEVFVPEEASELRSEGDYLKGEGKIDNYGIIKGKTEKDTEATEYPTIKRKKDNSHKKRSESHVSEAEKEVDDIVQKMLREEMLVKYGIYESFWRNKFECEECEANYFKLVELTKQFASQKEIELEQVSDTNSYLDKIKMPELKHVNITKNIPRDLKSCSVYS